MGPSALTFRLSCNSRELLLLGRLADLSRWAVFPVVPSMLLCPGRASFTGRVQGKYCPACCLSHCVLWDLEISWEMFASSLEALLQPPATVPAGPWFWSDLTIVAQCVAIILHWLLVRCFACSGYQWEVANYLISMSGTPEKSTSSQMWLSNIDTRPRNNFCYKLSFAWVRKDDLSKMLQYMYKFREYLDFSERYQLPNVRYIWKTFLWVILYW